jgi:hypothetical protein
MTIITASEATTAFISRDNSNIEPTNSTDYLLNSAGQYATLDRFAFTQKLFGTDPKFAETV